MKEMKDLKMKALKDVKALSDVDFRKEISSAEKTLFTLQMKKAVGEQKQTHLIKFLRRYIAQLKTLHTASIR